MLIKKLTIFGANAHLRVDHLRCFLTQNGSLIMKGLCLFFCIRSYTYRISLFYILQQMNNKKEWNFQILEVPQTF
ncbi:hypothetical protein, partial [Brevibacillus agri]|uniref:hypothetical protein n=1 Tax=Brevibacillus agri TaxID=51101 RepID=UPI0028683695